MSYYGGYGSGMGYGTGIPQQYYGGFQAQQTIPPALPQQDQGLIMVNGEEGARAFQLPPNRTVPLFDKNAMMFYLKTTDAGGFGSLRRFSYTEIADTAPAAPESGGGYLTRAEFEEWKKEYGECVSKTAGRRKFGSGSTTGEPGDT